MYKNSRAFTLIEMLIVLTIITVLLLLIIPNLSGQSKKVHSEGCEALINVVQSQVDTYYLDKGKYPVSLETLKENGYINEEQLTCRDGERLKYNASNGKVSK